MRFPEGTDAGILQSREPCSDWDDLSREVYCILGIPVDAIDMPTALRAVENAAAADKPFLISTPNLNYLVTSQLDPEFRETLLLSDLCPPDGMPIVWIARLLGLPIKDRVAGSDMVETLWGRQHCERQLQLFLFGGAEGAAEAAAKALNQRPGGLRCVGSIYPGFGSIEDMSRDDFIDRINASRADFLLVALGAQKGQLWLRRNHDRLRIPVRTHLGAVVNFVAGNVKRAPFIVRSLGLEWLWRIKEEPHLWRRYWNDGVSLLGLMITRVLPLALGTRWHQLRKPHSPELAIEPSREDGTLILSLRGAATGRDAYEAAAVFREALATNVKIYINLSRTSAIDARFLGLLLMLKKRAIRQNVSVNFVGASSSLRTLFRRNGAGFLLAEDQRE